MSAFLLRTARLHLRPCEARDVDPLHAILLDPDVRRWLLDDREVERAFVEELLEKSRRRFAERGFGHWVAADAPEGRLLGCFGLAEIEGGSDVEVLYALARPRWGRGLAAEATRAVLDHGFGACALPRIWARIDPPNRESRRLAERLGMRALGERPVGGAPLAHYVLERPRPS